MTVLISPIGAHWRICGERRRGRRMREPRGGCWRWRWCWRVRAGRRRRASAGWIDRRCAIGSIVTMPMGWLAYLTTGRAPGRGVAATAVATAAVLGRVGIATRNSDPRTTTMTDDKIALHAPAIRRSRAVGGGVSLLARPAQAVGSVHPVPGRWADLHQQQRRRTRAEGHRPGAPVVAVLRLGPRRTACRGDV